MVHRSDEQQHYFNTPFQLSIAPPGAEGVVLSDRSVAQCYIVATGEGNLNDETYKALPQHRTSLIQMDQGMVRVKLSFVAAVVEFS